MKPILSAALLAVLPLAAGCMSYGVDLASSTVPLSTTDDYTVVDAEAEGSAWGAMVLFFPMSELAQTELARDRAIDASGGEALVNVSVSQKSFFLPFVTLFKTTVRGEAVALPDDA